jgi:hypothetical protein
MLPLRGRFGGPILVCETMQLFCFILWKGRNSYTNKFSLLGSGTQPSRFWAAVFAAVRFLFLGKREIIVPNRLVCTFFIKLSVYYDAYRTETAPDAVARMCAAQKMTVPAESA